MMKTFATDRMTKATATPTKSIAAVENGAKLMKLATILVSSVVAALALSSAQAAAGFTCIWKGGDPECSSPAGVEDFPIRLRKTRALFEIEGCKVSEIMAWSKTAAPWTGAGYPKAMEIDISYQCTAAEARPKQKSTARYGFTCPARQFTYYESGFDFGADGKPMHWDSQGTATPIPPRDLSDTKNKTVEPLYKAWCQ